MSVDLHCGDVLDVLKGMEDNSFDAALTDPPYGLSGTPDAAEVLRHWLNGDDYAANGGGFMGKTWDSFVPGPATWKEVYRVLKPGAFLLAFGGTRTFDLLTMALRLAGFQVRDVACYLYGAGFPKSLDIGKQLDRVNGEAGREYKFTAWMRSTGMKSAEIDRVTGTNMGGHYTTAASQPAIPTRVLFEVMRPHIPAPVPDWVETLIDRVEAEREVIGQDTKARSTNGKSALPTMGAPVEYQTWDITAPATPLAATWDGYGTALKPAWEPCIVAMKPTDGTFANNAAKWQIAGINVDGCRIGTEQTVTHGKRNGTGNSLEWSKFETPKGWQGAVNSGRWPANLLLDEEAAALLDQQSGELGKSRGTEVGTFKGWQKTTGPRVKDIGYGDTGGASRFFYTAKASRREREAGLEGTAVRLKDDLTPEQRGFVLSELERLGVHPLHGANA